MTLHTKPQFNDPSMIAALKAHGMETDTPSMLADAFRMGRMSASPDWKPQRCEDCKCEFGGADCDWIKGRRK